MRALFEQEYVSRQELEQSIQTRRSSEAQLAQARAAADKDQVNLRYTTIRSPVSGVVVDRVVDQMCIRDRCQALPADAVYGVLEVVDLALCKNPTTREVWSFARVQAAQVGLAQSDFLPGIDGRLAAGRQTINSQSASQRSASLTLSWLLVDFGARSANLEAARQLLSAASATLDATVQSVFLDALQSYYLSLIHI